MIENYNDRIVILFGTGRASMECLVKMQGVKFSYFVDNNSSNWKDAAFVVKPPTSLLEEDRDRILIIIASMYYAEISQQLREMGFNEQEHFISYHDLFESQQEKRVQPWLLINGDKTLRLDYDLDEDSIVFDLGGYEGQWASDIYSKYCCNVHVFEPVGEFAFNITNRFSKNPRIQVFPFGLAPRDSSEQITVSKDGSSIFNKQISSFKETITLVGIENFLVKFNIRHIDLLKVNIEGGEFDLLEYLINTDIVSRISNIQVQFHDFVPNARERMEQIQHRLAETHKLTYQYEFVWENWRKI